MSALCKQFSIHNLPNVTGLLLLVGSLYTKSANLANSGLVTGFSAGSQITKITQLYNGET